MKQKILALLLGLTMAASLAASASATSQRHEVPVTLTIVDTEQRLSVTVPAALPVSVMDGYVVTASNAAIRNTAGSGSIQVTAVEVQPGAYHIGDFEHFAGADGSIALSLNGCPTRGAGELAITGDAFPAITPGQALAIRYQAKVGDSGAVSAAKAATVVFTIAAADQGGND